MTAISSVVSTPRAASKPCQVPSTGFLLCPGLCSHLGPRDFHHVFANGTGSIELPDAGLKNRLSW